VVAMNAWIPFDIERTRKQLCPDRLLKRRDFPGKKGRTKRKKELDSKLPSDINGGYDRTSGHHYCSIQAPLGIDCAAANGAVNIAGVETGTSVGTEQTRRINGVLRIANRGGDRSVGRTRAYN